MKYRIRIDDINYPLWYAKLRREWVDSNSFVFAEWLSDAYDINFHRCDDYVILEGEEKQFFELMMKS